MRGVDPMGLESVLKFFYTGECVLDHSNVIPVCVLSLLTACARAVFLLIYMDA